MNGSRALVWTTLLLIGVGIAGLCVCHTLLIPVWVFLVALMFGLCRRVKPKTGGQSCSYVIPRISLGIMTIPVALMLLGTWESLIEVGLFKMEFEGIAVTLCLTAIVLTGFLVGKSATWAPSTILRVVWVGAGALVICFAVLSIPMRFTGGEIVEAKASFLNGESEALTPDEVAKLKVLFSSGTCGSILTSLGNAPVVRLDVTDSTGGHRIVLMRPRCFAAENQWCDFVPQQPGVLELYRSLEDRLRRGPTPPELPGQ